MHTYWNLLVKRSADQVVLIWMVMGAPIVLVAPVCLWLVCVQGAGVSSLVYPLTGGLVQAAYSYLLARAYQVGDFSLTYPLARGSAPALIALAAWPLLDERVSVAGGAGIALVFLGVLLLHTQGLSWRGLLAMRTALRSRASAFALLCAATIATYHVIDKAGMADSHPIVYNYALHFPLFFALTLMVQPWRRRDSVRREWRERKWQVVLASLLCFGAYVLVLTAMTLWPVGYVASARNISILFAVFAGARALKEEHLSSRLAGAGLILGGIALLAAAG